MLVPDPEVVGMGSGLTEVRSKPKAEALSGLFKGGTGLLLWNQKRGYEAEG